MNKKDYILKLIEKLSEKCDFAKWLEILLRNKELDEETIDYLFVFLNTKIHEFLWKEQWKLTDILKKIKEEETLDKNENLEEEFLNLLKEI